MSNSASTKLPGCKYTNEELHAMAAAQKARREAYVQEARQEGSLPPARPEESPQEAVVQPLQFVSAAEVKDLPPVSWRMKNLLPAKGVAAIYGPPASGKSFLALDMTAAIAAGRDWFGHSTEKAPVFYVYLEGGGALKNRIAAWEQERERPFPAGVSFYLGAFSLFQDMDAILAAIPAGAVVIVDTLAAATPGFDENSSADMGLAIEALSRVVHEREGLAIVVHHSGKDASRGLRGHSSLLGALDAAISVDRSGASSARRWTLAKCKDAEDGRSFGFSLHRVELGEDADGEQVSSCVVRRMEVEQRDTARLSRSLQYGLDTLREALAGEETGRVHVDAWRAIFYRGHWADSQSAKRSAFHRARTDLVAAGLAGVVDDEYFLPSQGGQAETEADVASVASVAKRCKGVARNAGRTVRESETGVASVARPYRDARMQRSSLPDALNGNRTNGDTSCNAHVEHGDVE